MNNDELKKVALRLAVKAEKLSWENEALKIELEEADKEIARRGEHCNDLMQRIRDIYDVINSDDFISNNEHETMVFSYIRDKNE